MNMPVMTLENLWVIVAFAEAGEYGSLEAGMIEPRLSQSSDLHAA